MSSRSCAVCERLKSLGHLYYNLLDDAKVPLNWMPACDTYIAAVCTMIQRSQYLDPLYLVENPLQILEVQNEQRAGQWIHDPS